MNCKTCNFTLMEGQTVCPVCGTPVQGVVNNPESNLKQEVNNLNPKPVVLTPPSEPTNDVFGFTHSLTQEEPKVIFPEPVMAAPVLPGNDFIKPEPVMDTPIIEPAMFPQEVVMETPVFQPEVIQPPVNEVLPGMEFPQPVNVTPVLAPEEFLTLEKSVMPESVPTFKPEVIVQPAPMINTIEQNVSMANQATIEAPKTAKKGLGLIPTILIAIVVILGAAVVGYFGYRLLFKQAQVATLGDYTYRIDGKYSANIENKEKLLIYEQQNKTAAAWNMTITEADSIDTDFADLLTNPETLKSDIDIDYDIDKMDVKTVDKKQLIVFEVSKGEEVGYRVVTTNKLEEPLIVDVMFKSTTRDVKVLNILVDIVDSAQK